MTVVLDDYLAVACPNRYCGAKVGVPCWVIGERALIRKLPHKERLAAPKDSAGMVAGESPRTGSRSPHETPAESFGTAGRSTTSVDDDAASSPPDARVDAGSPTLKLECKHFATLYADHVRAEMGQIELWCETCATWKLRANT